MFIKKILKKIVSSKFFLNYPKGRRYIFLFHDVSDENEKHHSDIYSTSIKQFKKNISLINNFFHIIPLDELVSNNHLDNKNYASITFDDGFFSVLKNAYPVLSKLNIPFTIFVNGEAIKNNQLWVSNLILNKDQNYHKKLSNLTQVKYLHNKSVQSIYSNGFFDKKFCKVYKFANRDKKIYLNFEDIVFLVSKSVNIESHSFHHLVLSKCEKNLLDSEILDNKTFLANINKKDSLHFAIPFGKQNHYNESVIKKIRSFGYKYIYTTEANYFNKSNLNDENYLFPRITITNQSTSELMYSINRPLFFR